MDTNNIEQKLTCWTRFERFKWLKCFTVIEGNVEEKASQQNASKDMDSRAAAMNREKQVLQGWNTGRGQGNANILNRG